MPHVSPGPAARRPGDRGRDAQRLTRRRNVLLAQHHRAQGWSITQIAHLLDRAPATVRGYLHDPTGAKAKARKAGYAGACERCGDPTSGADGKGHASRHCQRCKPQSRARWTREAVRGAHRFWRERFGFIASSVDWSGTYARRRGGAALERYRAARWPSQSVIRRLYGSPASARADAFASGEADSQPVTGAWRDAEITATISGPLAPTTGQVTGTDGQQPTRAGDGQRRREQPSPGTRPLSDRPPASLHPGPPTAKA